LLQIDQEMVAMVTATRGDASVGQMTDEPVGDLEPVHTFDGPMPTGVTDSRRGRIFVSYPKWGDDVPFTVAKLRDGEAVAYPDEATNDTDPDDPAAALVSV